MKSLVIKNLTKKFGNRVIFDDVSLTLPSKGFFAFVGDSGSGKSTLLEMISGIDSDYSGEILTMGKPLKEMSENDRCDYRIRNIGFIRQHYDLLALENVFDNVALPLKSTKASTFSLKRKVKEALHHCQLKGKEKQLITTLSGGEKQRVALARALVNDPPILLADEPTGALDENNAEKIYELLAKISKEKLVILVSHDLERTKKYCNSLLFLENGKIKYQENAVKNEANTYLCAKEEKEKKPGVPFLTWLKHGYHLLRAKKGRTFLSTAILIFSLISLGLSLYVSRDLENQIVSSFSSLAGDDLIVMEKMGANPSFGRVISASEEDVANIAYTHRNFVDGYGVSYLANFESFFPDENSFYYLYKGERYPISDASARSINDYLWLGDYKSKPFYPEYPRVLEPECVCLVLPYQTMYNMCANLKILRDYDSLGEFLYETPLDLFLQVQNDSWNYWDLQYFKVIAVTQGERFKILHHEQKWNEWVFETQMTFPSVDEDIQEKPWDMRKVFYIQTKQEPQDFFKSLRTNPLYNNYQFERSNYLYDHTNNYPAYASDMNRYYVYVTDNDYIDTETINELKDLDCFASFEVYGENAYSAYPDSLALGFTNPFFLGSTREGVELASDAMGRVPKDLATGNLELPRGVVEGSILKPKNNSLTFSNDFRNLIDGRAPTNEKEVCISSALSEKIGNGPNLFCAGMVSSKVDGDYIERDYRIGELTVVGIVENQNDVLYAEDYWCVDYWRDVFGMSPFLLGVSKVSFSLKEGYSKEQVIKALSSRYQGYRFVDPSKAIKESVSPIINYVKTALNIASLTTLAIASFLLIVIAILTGLENKSEGKLLFYLGIKRGEITNSYGAGLLLMIGYSIIVSSFSIFMLELVFDEVIQDVFMSNAPFTPDLMPIFVAAFVGFIGYVISYFLIDFWVKRRNFKRE